MSGEGEQRGHSHSRSSESKAGTFDSTVVSSREDRIMRVDPLVMMKQSIAQLQQQNARMRAEMALKTVEHAKQLQQLNASKAQELASRLACLTDQNLNLNSLLQVLQEELEAVKECIRRKDEQLRRREWKEEQLQLKISQLEQSKEQLLCMFKRFESRDLYQAVRDLNCCQEVMMSNVQSLVEAQQRAGEDLRGEHQNDHRKYLQTLRQLELAGEESSILKDIDQEVEEFRKTILLCTNKHIKGKTELLDSLAGRVDTHKQAENLLDDGTNIYKKRIQRLKAVVVRLLNSLRMLPQLKVEISRLSKHLNEIGSILNQHYSQMFQRAIESIRRRLHNANLLPPPTPPKQASSSEKPPQPAKSKRKRQTLATSSFQH